MFSSNTTQTSGGYEIQRSLRFNSADSTFLNRTPSTATNRRTWTWSGWVKRSALSTDQAIFGRSNSAGSAHTGFIFQSDNTIQFFSDGNGPYSILNVVTTQLFRDTSAWYHLVFVLDTTQATASNRIKIYVNGVQVTSFTTANYPSLNDEYQINTTNPHGLGRYFEFSGNYFFNGYMTEVNFIDGQALTPSSFGEINADTGVWQPKRYAGSYGTNGFYLNFSNNSNTTAATLGADYSGNGNNWTPNNFSVSAGAGNDSLVDSPTSYGTDTGVGGSVRGNYCTLNPLDKTSTVTAPLNGNLQYNTANSTGLMRGTLGVRSAKWYYEATITTVPSAGSVYIGVKDSADPTMTSSNGLGSNSGTTNEFGYAQSGFAQNNGSATGYGVTLTSGDVLMVAYDLDSGKIWWGKNGTWISSGNPATGANAIYSTLTSANGYSPAIGYNSTFTDGVVNFNFGQRPFAYTAPSGFKALNTQNLPTPTIGATTATQANKYFDIVLRNGGGSSGGTYSTTVNMANGALLWDKLRTPASNYLVDSVRGISKALLSNSTAAEETDANWFINFGTNSYTTGSSDWSTVDSIVEWIWAANGAGVTNTAGTITSTVSANTTSGFSVVRWTQPGSGTYTIGHGLGAAPAMIIMKSSSNTGNWSVYHRSLGHTQYISLNLTGGAVTDSSVWVAAPTSSVFSQLVNYGTAGTSVAYCFAEVPGYSRFGSYTGNGSADGPFVFCGFRPAWVLVRRSDGSDDWHLFDNKRIGYNVRNEPLYPNGSYAEGSGFNYVDLLSNGFKMRNNSYENLSGVTYIFAAFAEAPQKFALAR